MKKIIKILGIIVVAAIVIGAIAFIVPKLSQKTPATTSGNLTSVKANGGKIVENQQLLAVLQSVNSITLKDSILRDPAFQSLSDISLSIARTDTEGRINPFAEIPGAAVAPLTTPGIIGTANTTVTQ